MRAMRQAGDAATAGISVRRTRHHGPDHQVDDVDGSPLPRQMDSTRLVAPDAPHSRFSAHLFGLPGTRLLRLRVKSKFRVARTVYQWHFPVEAIENNIKPDKEWSSTGPLLG